MEESQSKDGTYKRSERTLKFRRKTSQFGTADMAMRIRGWLIFAFAFCPTLVEGNTTKLVLCSSSLIAGSAGDLTSCKASTRKYYDPTAFCYSLPGGVATTALFVSSLLSVGTDRSLVPRPVPTTPQPMRAA